MDFPKQRKEEILNYAPKTVWGINSTILAFGIYPKVPSAAHDIGMSERGNVIHEFPRIFMQIPAGNIYEILLNSLIHQVSAKFEQIPPGQEVLFRPEERSCAAYQLIRVVDKNADVTLASVQ